jgi:dTDP-4-amino-4,6-dideoxygalactose transaminase
MVQRKKIWDTYAAGLEDWATANDVQLPTILPYCEQAYHMFYVVLPSLEARTRLIEHLKSKGILSVFHYLPLHLSPMGQGYGYGVGDCPVTESISDRLVRLPFYNDLSLDDQAEVIEAIHELSS